MSSVGCVRENDSAKDVPSGQTSRVIRILEAYLTELEQGGQPHPDELVAQYPDLADVLRAYLNKLEVLHHAAAGLRSPTQEAFAAGGLPDRGRLGDYLIVREIGRGGMGVVYEAEQISLRRRVALKVLPFAAALDGKQLQRFKNEAQAAAHLHHTNIVPVHAVGCERGTHYYAMQFIEGQPLSSMIVELRQLSGLQRSDSTIARPSHAPEPPAEEVPDPSLTEHNTNTFRKHEVAGQSSTVVRHAGVITKRSSKDPEFFRSVAQLGVQAAEALEHAHQMGVVHRDIKPANLLVDARVHLWITDFGLALCQTSGGLTLTGDLVGTLRYMSPEQALGKRALVDHRTDIYSLGVTLYEFLTLEPAHPGRDRPELLHQIAYAEPRPLRRINPAIPVELETIILKAMAKEPEARYATAQELADDLRRFLENKPILARRPRWPVRLSKWMRRHRPFVWTACGIMALSLVGLAISSVLIWTEKEKAETERGNAQAALEKYRQQVEQTWAQAAKAESEQRRTEEHFRKACYGVTQLLLRLEDTQWKGDEKMKRLRRDLAEQSREFLVQGFVNEKSTDPAVRLETARTYRVVASINGIKGESAQVKADYAKAIKILDQLAIERPADPVYRYELALSHNILGLVLYETGPRKEAKEEFRKAMSHYRLGIQMSRGEVYGACSQNDLAWMLATCPDTDLRNAGEAVDLASKAVGSMGCAPCVWNTLGVAHYRAGNFQRAVEALNKSMERNNGGDAIDWFFLAMAYYQLGKKDQAAQWYKLADQQLQKANLSFEPVSHFKEEADKLLHSEALQERKEKGPASDENDGARRSCPPRPTAPAKRMTGQKVIETTC